MKIGKNMGFDPAIFKAYDIRGVFPTQLDEETAYKIAQGYARVFKPAKPVVVGRDVRNSAPVIQAKVIKGLSDAGVDVVDIGLVSTEEYYFAVGRYGYGGGIQVTASHNPKEYIGMKMVLADVVPVSGENGIYEIRNFVQDGEKNITDKKGTVSRKDVLDDFCKFALDWLDRENFKPMKLVYNPNFGFEGKVLNRLVEIGKLPFELIPLNAEPNGDFPKGRPDPFIPENRPEFVELVKKSRADMGVAWDADADRVFFCTGDGTFIDSYYINALLIKLNLKKYPGGKIIYDPRYTWALIDATNEAGGIPILERVGHSYIKAGMRKENAIFSGESSGHTFYRDFWFADSGILPLFQVINLINGEGKTLDKMVKSLMEKYFISGEINSEVEDKEKIFKQVSQKYSDAKQSDFDGLSIEYDDWRANIRASNTEPVFRLNLEAKSRMLMEEKRDELLSIIRGIK